VNLDLASESFLRWTSKCYLFQCGSSCVCPKLVWTIISWYSHARVCIYLTVRFSENNLPHWNWHNYVCVYISVYIYIPLHPPWYPPLQYIRWLSTVSRSTIDQPRCHKCLVAPSMYCKTSTKLKSRASHGVAPILLGISWYIIWINILGWITNNVWSFESVTANGGMDPFLASLSGLCLYRGCHSEVPREVTSKEVGTANGPFCGPVWRQKTEDPSEYHRDVDNICPTKGLTHTHCLGFWLMRKVELLVALCLSAHQVRVCQSWSNIT
jgi:hypothetical protein